MPDMIFVSLENWDEVWRRNQFFCANLVRRFPEMKLLFVALPFDVSHELRHGRVRKLWRPMEWGVPGYPNIAVIHPLKLLPNSLTICRKANEWSARVHIRAAARRLGIRKPILWLNPHGAMHMAGRMSEKCVIYDITDDWTLQQTLPTRERSLTEKQDRALCRRADMVVVCSEALLRSRKPLCKRIALIKNGVDVKHYESVRTAPASRAWASPVFGYTGTLHSERTDARLLIALAKAYPEGSVVLVGPDHLTDTDRQHIRKERNVHATGPVPYARIPEVMAQFDVCIVPHLETAFIDSLNPIKLWEYLAAGKPIVSTNIAGFREYGHLCRIASGPDAFVTACGEVLVEDNALVDARISEASRHTWDARVDELLSIMGEANLIPERAAEVKSPVGGGGGDKWNWWKSK